MSGTITIAAGFELATGEVLTTSKLNRMVAEMSARVDAGAIGTRELADGSIPLDKLDADLQGDIGVGDGAISTAKLEDGCLAASGTGRAKMGTGFVTAGKLAAGAVVDGKIAAGAVTAGKLASGIGVANVAMGTLTSVVTLSANAWGVISGLSVTITPTRATSKILLMLHVSGCNGYSGGGICLRIKRNGTILTVGDSVGGSRKECAGVIPYSYANYAPLNGDILFLDTPGSTASASYTVEAYGYNAGSGSVYINRGYTDTDSADFARGACSIVATELLA